MPQSENNGDMGAGADDGVYLEIRNWKTFQHYKDRNPPWIKLHFELLASEDWVVLDDASRVLAVACMLVASRNMGKIRVDSKGARYLQRVAYLNQTPDFNPLIECGFLIGASGCKQVLADARPETYKPETYKPETYKTSCAPKRTTARFDEFWEAYPVKRDKKKARDKWKVKDLDHKADSIISDVKTRAKVDRQWLDGYIPLPTTYLNGERWEDEIATPRLRAVSGTSDDAAERAIALRRSQGL